MKRKKQRAERGNEDRGQNMKTDVGFKGENENRESETETVLSDMPAGPCVPAHSVRAGDM